MNELNQLLKKSSPELIWPHRTPRHPYPAVPPPACSYLLALLILGVGLDVGRGPPRPSKPHQGLLEAQKTSPKALLGARPCETEVTQEAHSSDCSGTTPLNLNLGSSKLGSLGNSHL